MQREEFHALTKQGFNRIPLVKEVLADLETPLSLYVKLSQAFGEKIPTYSSPYQVVSVLADSPLLVYPLKRLSERLALPQHQSMKYSLTEKQQRVIPIIRQILQTLISNALRLPFKQVCRVFAAVLLATLAMTLFGILNHAQRNIICQMNSGCLIFSSCLLKSQR